MDLKKLALALGLKEDAKPEEIFAKLAERDAKSQESVAAMTALSSQLKDLGFEMKDGKVSKIEKLSTTPNPTDDSEKADMRKRLAEVELDALKVKLSVAEAEAEKYITSGKVPPALRAELKEVLSIVGETHKISLSTDQKTVSKTAFNALEAVKKLISGLPTITDPSGLSQHLGVPGSEGDKKKAEELATLGRNVAKKVQGTAAK